VETSAPGEMCLQGQPIPAGRAKPEPGPALNDMRPIPRALACLLLCLPIDPASAAVDLPESLDPGLYPIDPVIEIFSDGWIDWSAGMASAWGRTPAKESGDMNNTPALREMAATRDARERLWAVIGDIRIGPAGALSADPAAISAVQSLIDNAPVAQKRERGRFLEVRLTLPMYGPVGIVRALRGGDDSGMDVPVAPAGKDEPTGVVIDARGTGLSPSLFPRILDPASATLWSVEAADPFTLMMRGVAGYGRMIKIVSPGPTRLEILKSPVLARTGARPVHLRAMAAAGDGGADIVLDEESASALAGSGRLRLFLAEARLVIVID